MTDEIVAYRMEVEDPVSGTTSITYIDADKAPENPIETFREVHGATNIRTLTWADGGDDGDV